MLKNKRILFIIILAVGLFLVPSMCNAAAITATETTQTSTGKTITWCYELEGDSIINLSCVGKGSVSGEVVIPSTIDGHTVVSLNGTFKGSVGLTGVTIPNTVMTIGNESFDGCIALKNINIPNSVTTIGFAAFEGCSGVSSIEIPNSVIEIGNRAFSGWSTIKNITIPSSVISIGEEAFLGCRNLRELVIPDNVTSIGKKAFSGCSGLTSVKISNELTIINEAVFYGCSGITSIVIPESVTTISGGYSWDGAFAGCSGLTKILIPNSVATIESNAFEDCDKLTIYGNDNQASKKYAEDNKIKFDYIANWNKKPASGDITPPELKSLMIDYSSVFKYDEGTNYYLVAAGINIAIKATFEEDICGEIAPMLTIKCGNGEKIELTNGSIQGKYIIYTYTIKDQDKGIISAVSMTGGDIADEAGNKVEKYTCPELVTSYIVGKNHVYANGKGSSITDEGNNGGTNQNPSTTVTLSSIAITKTPTRNTYSEGEKFDKAGMVITATYSDGTKKEITNYSINLTEVLKTTDTKVVITYTENNVTKTVEQKITVTPKTTSITLTSIKITKAPTKTKYTEGEKFSKNGMVITATYSDGTTKEITNYSISTSGTLKTTNKKITITYTENSVTKTAEQTINVSRDTTTKGDNKLPQTGAALLSLALISLIVVATISKFKYGKYKDI